MPPPLTIRTTVFGVVLYLEVLFLPNIQAGSEPAPCPPSQLGLQFSVLYYISKFSSSLIYRQVLSQPRAPPPSQLGLQFSVLYYISKFSSSLIYRQVLSQPRGPPPTLSIRTTVFGVVLYLEVLFLPNIQAGSEPAPCPPPSQLGLQFSVLYYILKFSSSLIYRQVLSQPRAPPPHN